MWGGHVGAVNLINHSCTSSRLRGDDPLRAHAQVEEMERDEALGGWTYACRCGEAFQVCGRDNGYASVVCRRSNRRPKFNHAATTRTQQVLEAELPEGAAILVTCDGCSLRARVHRRGGGGEEGAPKR